MSPPRRNTRSNTKAVDDIPLPPTRKPPKTRAKPKKNVQDPEDRGPHERNAVVDKSKNPSKLSMKKGNTNKGKAKPTPQAAEESSQEDEPNPHTGSTNPPEDDEVENSSNNKSARAGNVRPRPIPQKDAVRNPNDDSSFISARHGW
ncbi:hypothetical protein Hypma_010399 [Hypsizygus marmoreus]|uniref:Uncharacterized protein n=1 Tax=Hypsizygus marmoreus TaxID=39966 RepID=A0A369JM69_HYPMA|nr:hypothetical protein Hypma_010399 [Hypsizygus marmoreus]